MDNLVAIRTVERLACAVFANCSTAARSKKAIPAFALTCNCVRLKPVSLPRRSAGRLRPCAAGPERTVASNWTSATVLFQERQCHISRKHRSCNAWNCWIMKNRPNMLLAVARSVCQRMSVRGIAVLATPRFPVRCSLLSFRAALIADSSQYLAAAMACSRVRAEVVSAVVWADARSGATRSEPSAQRRAKRVYVLEESQLQARTKSAND